MSIETEADWNGLRRMGALLSVNDEVVHGVPGARRLEDGDVLKVDVTADLSG